MRRIMLLVLWALVFFGFAGFFPCLTLKVATAQEAAAPTDGQRARNVPTCERGMPRTSFPRTLGVQKEVSR
jgi:hypothetical protein